MASPFSLGENGVLEYWSVGVRECWSYGKCVFQYALTVSGYDFDAYRDRAMMQLTAAAKLEPRTAYEKTIQGRAMRLLDLLNANKRDDYLALVNRYQGYP